MARPLSFDPDLALEKAMDLFWSRGYHRVSVEDIVRVTGLNRHSLYSRFGSKYGLLVAALKHYRQAVLHRIESILNEPALSPRERINRLFGVRQDHPDSLWTTMRSIC